MKWEQIIRFCSTYSIGVAAIIGLVRFKSILKSYRPFIYFSCVAFINEIVSGIMIKKYGSNTINNNIYSLLEFLFILWLFVSWGVDPNKKKYYSFIAIILISLWIIEYLFVHSLSHISSVYLIGYYFVLIFLSIHQINYVLITERKNLVTNSRFIISSVFLFSFTYAAILEVFFYIDLKGSPQFYHQLFFIYIVVNLFMNMFLALAVLWIPTKQKFTLPY